MAVSFTTTIGTTDYGFDWVNKIIEIESGVLEITAGDLRLAIHDAQDGTEGITFDQIANFGNPVVLTASTSTFLNVILLSTWKILSLSTTATFTVGSGNVVHITDGIAIFDSNVLVTLVNNTSAAGVLVESGVSGLTGSESAQLALIDTLNKVMVNKFITDPGTGVLTIYDNDGTSVLFQGPIWEDAAGTVPYQGRGIERRDRLT